VTEIYDYLRLLWARIGVPHCPECGEEITGQTQEQIVDRLMTLADGTKFTVMAPVVRGRKGEYGKLLEQMRLEGYSRAKVNGELRRLDEEIALDKKYKHNVSIVVDRLVMKSELRRRLSESVEAAAGLAAGLIEVEIVDGEQSEPLLFSEQFAYLDPRAGAADLLLQLAPRRLRALPRPRLPAGHRPRAGRPRPDPLARRGRPAALEPRHHRLLEAADRRRRRDL
jgi:excinuclease UvrABC ATPase subunit